MKQDYVRLVMKKDNLIVSSVWVSAFNLTYIVRDLLMSYGYPVGPGGFNAENVAAYLRKYNTAYISDTSFLAIAECY